MKLPCKKDLELQVKWLDHGSYSGSWEALLMPRLWATRTDQWTVMHHLRNAGSLKKNGTWCNLEPRGYSVFVPRPGRVNLY